MKIISILIPLVVGVATVAEADYMPPLPEKVAQVFTSRFFPSALDRLHENANIILSGFSLLQPLTQLTLASQGEPHDELISNGFGLIDDEDVKLVAKTYKELFGPNQDAVKLVHKVYVSNKTQINESYADELTKNFGPGFEVINFIDPNKAAGIINEFVEVNTNRKIKNLVNYEELSPETDLVLVNTVYFKSEWESKFPKVYTAPNTFFYDEGRSVEQDFMLQENFVKYGESLELNAELLQLNYKSKGFFFNIALPKELTGLPALLEKYKKHNGNLYVANNKFSQQLVRIYLPKFEIEAGVNLIPVLRSLGIKRLFEDDRGNLRNLLLDPRNLLVSSATQKVFINVDEKGTEAASANDAVVNPTESKEKPVVFKANYPFYFEVNYYGYTLFSGTVTFDPRYKN